MLLVRDGSWPEHRPWFRGVVAATVAAALWHATESHLAGAWLGGSSRPGFVLGVIAGLIIAFEMALWVRKRMRASRLGRMKLWLKAHVWLGLLAVPLAVLHSGFRWTSGGLSAATLAVFLIVIASGLWGLAIQQILPSLMLDRVQDETIHGEIGNILSQHLEEATRLVERTCGVRRMQREAAMGRLIARRDVRMVGRSRGTALMAPEVRNRIQQAAPVEGSSALLEFFETTVRPYLTSADLKGSPLETAKGSATVFRDVRLRLDPAAHPAVDDLERLCERRRQFGLQSRLHAWLHGWLCIHVPLSMSLFVLLIAHIYFALRYL